MKHIGIIGAGSWGTALAVTANRAGAEVTLWSRNHHVLESIAEKNRNLAYLPDVFLDPAIKLTDDIGRVSQSDMLLLVIPAQHIRNFCIALSDHLDPSVPVVICAKGIERGSMALMSEVVEAVLPNNPVAVLTGPNFAMEVAQGKPTATTIACRDEGIGEQIVFALGTSVFRPYFTTDVMGAQIGGAVKNVIAIACGIARGKGLGENATAALITRAMTEIWRLSHAKGGKMETLMGLSGMGDLMLTCTSSTSRNTRFGMELGKGKPLEEVISAQESVTEGVATAESVHQLAEMLHVDMPLCEAVYDVLYRGLGVDGAISQLLERPFTKEAALVG